MTSKNQPPLDTTVPEPKSDATPVSSTPRPRRSLREWICSGLFVALILVIFSSIFVAIMVIPVTYFYEKRQGEVVKLSQPAGHVVSVTLLAGLLTRSVVETETGFYSLTDGVSIKKGESLTQEASQNGNRALCDESHRCTRIF